MDDGEKKSFQHNLRRTWMQALGVISGAEAEMARAAQRMLEGVGARAGEAPAAVREAARELMARVKSNGEALERRVDEGVRSALSKVEGPLTQEMQALRGRLEAIHRRVEELASRKGGGERPAPGSSDAGPDDSDD